MRCLSTTGWRSPTTFTSLFCSVHSETIPFQPHLLYRLVAASLAYLISDVCPSATIIRFPSTVYPFFELRCQSDSYLILVVIRLHKSLKIEIFVHFSVHYIARIFSWQRAILCPSFWYLYYLWYTFSCWL